MAFTSSVVFTATGGGTTLSGISSTITTGTSLTEIAVSVPASTTDQLYAIAIDVSNLESIFLYTDGALTIETNSGSAADDTIVFSAANMPLVWVNGFPTVDGTSQIPLDVDVTAFYLTNATGSAVTLYGVINQSI